jgi:hypothetical protein
MSNILPLIVAKIKKQAAEHREQSLSEGRQAPFADCADSFAEFNTYYVSEVQRTASSALSRALGRDRARS